MPNWIAHLGITFIIYKSFKIKLKDLRLILLGSIAPDITSIVYILFLDFFKLPVIPQEAIIWYFEPYHTPFLAIFYSLIIALLTKGNHVKNFILFYSAVLIHFLLDSFQFHIGFYQPLLYPFSFKNINFSLFPPGHLIFNILSVISIIFIIWAFIIHKNEYKFEKKYIRYVIILTIFTLSFPFLTKNLFYKNNFHYLQFFKNKKNFQNKKIEICVSKVINTEPLQIKELNKKLTLDYKGPETFKKNDMISFKGIYKNGRVSVTYLKKDNLYHKTAISAIGMLMLFLFFIKPKKYNK